MFVDKKLSGVKAVQTLSRLNRTMRGKDSTFVLDFVNTAEEMKKSFEPYYEATVLEQETDPNVIYTLKNTLDGYRVYNHSEIERFAELFFGVDLQSAGDLGKLSAVLIPAIDRYKVKSAEDKDLFSATLARFVRIYAFITQVCRMFDKDMHKFSVYAKFLYKVLPKDSSPRVDLDDKVLMEYYRLEKDFSGSISLSGTEGGFAPIKGEAGTKKQKKDTLTQIIEKINEKFGTQFTEMDKVLAQMESDFSNDEKWVNYAQSNDENTFRLLFRKGFMEKAALRYEQNDAFFIRMFKDADFMQFMMDLMRSDVYKKLGRKSQLIGRTIDNSSPHLPYADEGGC